MKREMMQDRHPDGETPDILIVEDSATQAQHLADLLRFEGGYRVRIAADGAAGLAAARACAPTMIVSDISMPVMDGFTMCQEVKKDPALRDIPVILLTSLTSLYDVIRGLDCGADNFIRKPYDAKYLLGRVRFILANRALRRGERVQLGMQVTLGGQTHFITAERQQIFDLLISTYEEAIQMTEELKLRQEEIARSYQTLEGLYRIAEALNPALTERAVAEQALDGALELPGVLGGCVSLLDGAGALRVVAAHETGGAPAVPGTVLDCGCAHDLVAGALRAPEPLHACEALGGVHACVPLVAGTRILGLLHLRTGAHQPAAEELQMFGTIGNQIAVAIERAHLYANMEALVRERTEALQSERNLLSAVVETSGALVVLIDPAGQIVLFNRACETALGWPASDALGRPAWEVFRLDGDESAVRRFLHDLPFEQTPPQVPGQWLARDGTLRSIIWTVTPLHRADGSVEYMLGTGMDTTALRGAQKRLEYVNNFDTLTGLPNRVLLRDRMPQQKAQARTEAKLLGLMLLRCERLHLIRETLGLGAEQALLLQVAARLSSLDGTDSVARFAESSFALVAMRQDEGQLALAARNLLAVMERPFLHAGEELHLDPRIGIAVFPNDGLYFEDLVRGAETALRRAGGALESHYEFYRPELNRGASERFKLESALRRAIERDEFELHYQPQVTLGSGAIVGFEALVRWRHPERGLVGPGAFIALAEETGLILPIGEWVLRRACGQCRAWQDAGLPVVPVSVNLSARQFSEQIPQTVRRILDETGLDPKLLELELTESASMDAPEKSFEILRELKAMGIGLAIDDFGTGYSNLNYLKRFPVDKLKLDQSFVRDIVSDPDDLSIARAVIAMAHGLRLTVIAEGVEDAGQLALLAAHGCDEIQGYLFSRPVEPEACAQMLRDQVALPLAALLREPYERTLLYVDDEVNLQAAIRRALRQRGYKVVCASDAAAAFDVLARTEVGVILCDQRMPGLSGTEFLARVKGMYPDVVRMVLSGYTDLQSVTDAVNHGAIFKFLTKPWIDDELDAALREAFAGFEQKRAAPRGAGVR
jgi:PAS domain S-box-containing protein/diguanylate cyclase (GGDEF)-like protein